MVNQPPIRCEELRRKSADRWSLKRSMLDDGSILVSAPFAYDDGDSPQALVTAAGGLVRVEDFGTAVGRLAQLGIAPEDGPLETQVFKVAHAHRLAS